MSAVMSRFSTAFGNLLAAADFSLGPLTEIVLAGPASSAETQRLRAAVYSLYFPNKVVAHANPDFELNGIGREELPLTKGKTTVVGRPAVYLCRDHQCLAPITKAEILTNALLHPLQAKSAL
jgi:hypothetical protein